MRRDAQALERQDGLVVGSGKAPCLLEFAEHALDMVAILAAPIGRTDRHLAI